jgi:hypothetical protein
VQSALFEGSFLWLSSACKTLGGPTVGLSALVVGASLGQAVHKFVIKKQTPAVKPVTTVESLSLKPIERPQAMAVPANAAGATTSPSVSTTSATRSSEPSVVKPKAQGAGGGSGFPSHQPEFFYDEFGGDDGGEEYVEGFYDCDIVAAPLPTAAGKRAAVDQHSGGGVDGSGFPSHQPEFYYSTVGSGGEAVDDEFVEGFGANDFGVLFPPEEVAAEDSAATAPCSVEVIKGSASDAAAIDATALASTVPSLSVPLVTNKSLLSKFGGVSISLESGAIGHKGWDLASGDGQAAVVAVKEEPLPDMRVIAAFVFTRMVLCPLFGVGLVYMFGDRLIQSKDPNDAKLIKLILVLEAAVPSADAVIITCQQAGRTVGSQGLALAYLLQYLVSIVTLTTATTFAIGWIYGDDVEAADAAIGAEVGRLAANVTSNVTLAELAEHFGL